MMITIRTRTFESTTTAEVAISKLDWKIEKVKQLNDPFLNNSTTDTAQEWVGKINKDTGKFEILQTAPYFAPRILEGNFFSIFIFGHIIKEEHGCKIVLNFRLNLKSTLFFVLIYMTPIIMAVNYFQYEVDINLFEVLFGNSIPLLLTLLLIGQLNNTENKLIDLFGV